MDDMNLQSLQVSGKHSPLSVVQSRQIFRTGLSEDPSGEGDKIATLVHGTDGGIAIEIQFAYVSDDGEYRFQDEWIGRFLSCH
jgi:hypothetical protein